VPAFLWHTSFLGAHYNFLTVPTWHTKNSDYFFPSKFLLFGKNLFWSFTDNERSPKLVSLSEWGRFVTYVMNLQNPFTPGTLIVWGAQ
jgi:hypothetical protein